MTRLHYNPIARAKPLRYSVGMEKIPPTKEDAMRTKDLWVKSGAEPVEVYRSSYSIGSRYSLLGRNSCYNVRPGGFGINSWARRVDAHAFLTSKGYTKKEG
jgi:hypothetical protein